MIHAHVRTEADPGCDAGQCLFTDEPLAHPGHRAFMLLRILAVQTMADQQLEHGVAQKFEPLVVLRTQGRVTQSQPEQLLILKAVAEGVHQLL